MPRSGTLVICVQNLDFSGANQVVLNIVAGRVHHSNIVVLSPKMGTFAARFVDSGAAVRVGDLEELLNQIRDVFCIICNTIMTANIVVEMVNRVHPVIWILHEWWDDDMISENLKLRNYKDLTLQTVKTALAKASMVVFVCESQRKLYNPTAPSSVIFVGVPDPLPRHIANGGSSPFSLLSNSKDSPRAEKNPELFTFLCLGIVCPRKNQLWTVQLFKEFAKDKPNVRLKVVGARYTRVYEIEYLEQVKKEIDGDPRIELLDVTDYVDVLYQTSDALILTSLNEVTPMVISEALSWSLPVLSTNIAGIKEMFRDGKEGYLFEPGDATKALAGMESVYSNKRLRHKMAVKARVRFERAFDLDLMVNSYQELIFAVAPPVILLDMDGVVVDWDGGFHEVWKDRCPVDRTKSYYIEDCVEPSYRKEAIDCFKSKGFFLNLKPMDGALEAIREMQADGLQIYICTSPVRHSVYCAQEKIEWVTQHLGEEWIDKIILCQEKSSIVGDILIDDKPFDFLYPKGKHTAAPWKQVLFDAPYNNQTCMQSLPRLTYWQDWRTVIYPMMGKSCLVQQRGMEDTVSFPSGGALVQIQAVDVGVNSFRMGMNDIGFGRDRSETTESQLIEGVFLQPHLDLPPVGRPIGMVKLRRSEFTDEVSSVCSDTTTSTTTAGGATGAKSRSLSAALTADDVQRGVDMMLTEQGKLRPEDIATILSGSMSLMSEDNDDACSETGSSNHPGTGNVTSGAGSVKSTVGGENSTSNEAMRALASAVAYDGIAGAIPEGQISNSAAAQAVGERNELAERLTAAAEKKNADHNASVQSNQHKQALDSDVNEQEGLQLFRRAYALWKGRPSDKSPR